jgi:hypothetical protein
MMDLPTAEKIKNSKLALIAGLLIGLSLGAWGAWTASTTIHEAQFKVLDAVNKDLQRQVAELETSGQAKDAEMARLREQLSKLSPQRREAELKRRTELERFIQRVDKEIAERKAKLWRPGWGSRECDPKGENCRWVRSEDRPMSDAEVRLARELEALNVERHEAHRRLIEFIGQNVSP